MSTMRGRAGPIFTVLVLFLVFAGIAWLRTQREKEDYPTGSSHSVEPDGARALFLWLEAVGARVDRLEGNQSILRARPDVLFIVQPSFGIGTTGRIAFDDVAERGGTIILAGHSPTFVEYASDLGVRATFAGSVAEEATTLPTASSPRLTVPVHTRINLDGGPASRTLLQAPDGRVVAVRTPYKRGSLVVIASPLPLTNEGLRDPDTARFIHRELIAPATVSGSPTILFDESLHLDPRGGLSPDASLTTRIQRFVLNTPLGWAAVYAGLLIFLYLFLSGRRLGPALRPVRAEAASRTMYEHVQAMAGLYRRGGQFLALRAHFSRHYRRRVARALGSAVVLDRPLAAPELVERGLSPARAQAIVSATTAIDAARGERPLGDAVRQADAALDGLRSASIATRESSYPDKAAA